MTKHTRKKSVSSNVRARPPATSARPPRASDGGSWLAWGAGFVSVASLTAASFGWSTACKHEPPPGAAPPPAALPPGAGRARVASTADAGSEASSAVVFFDPTQPYDGPLIGSMVTQAPIYIGMEAYRDKRIGYIRHGGKAPVDPTPIKSPNCEAGWYRLLAGGYVCGKFATLDLNNSQVRLGTTPPNLDDLLPYRYAWNTSTGTPLYKSVPSRQDMAEYEPYLAARTRRRVRPPDPDPDSDNPYGPVAPNAAADAGTTPFEENKPWWQSESDGGIKLSDLTLDSDPMVARRLVKGFFVAIDREFNWNGRLWYKTTGALVAPADRFVLNKPPTLKGVELGGIDGQQGGAFILSTRALRYAVDVEKHQLLPLGPVERFTAVRTTGRSAQFGASTFRETSDGWWMRDGDGTHTEPGPAPSELLPGEKWIDVNLSRQTLVAFEGDKPVYASLASSGKKARDPNDKLHDHQTLQGSFRIREKHISTTMDGDGPAPGDMPYSIEDVPYVMYFEGSYALHAAFWHSNFGHEQSHGCVNLAPLDAKHLFFWADPFLPQGWHGVIAPKEKQGTRVVVHE